MPIVTFVLVAAFVALLMKLACALTSFAIFVSIVFYIVRRLTCTQSATKQGISEKGRHKSSDILGSI
jgi:hypothetical protein